jgi:hypothetical protein
MGNAFGSQEIALEHQRYHLRQRCTGLALCRQLALQASCACGIDELERDEIALFPVNDSIGGSPRPFEFDATEP